MHSAETTPSPTPGARPLLRLPRRSALNLTLGGSVGQLVVEDPQGRGSVRVQWLQTHLRLQPRDLDEALPLRALRPFREVFPIQDLDFEQIMQRDIDDARVATELIPYLLEESRTGLVKLFPPIIVVVLPVTEQKLPAAAYPPVTEREEEADGVTQHVLRAGEVGSEVFELRQVVAEGERWDHDYARLKLNTNRSALVIVDGQHRAMALIALYRNCTRWPEGARGAEPYYKLWSRSVLERYDLSGVRLPVMFCVFPELDGREGQPMKVYEACRAVFLALNKNARKVTRARNYLLDDRDVLSALLRDVLTLIKEGSDLHSASSVRLWNVELDATEDKVRLHADAAITGVMHLYTLIERLVLRDPPGDRLVISGAGRPQTRLDACFERLGLSDRVSRAARSESRRDSVDPQTRALMVEAFRARYGRLIVRGLGEFAPYAAHNQAALNIEQKLSGQATAEFYRALLFEGQNMDSIFESKVEWLKDQLNQKELARTPEVKAVKRDFDERKLELERWRAQLREQRLDLFLGGTRAPLREHLEVRRVLDELHRNTFTTAAFQLALLLTFFAGIDAENTRRSRPPVAQDALTPDEVDALFSDYLKQVNEVFTARSPERLRLLLRLLYGELTVQDEQVELSPSAFTLRRILIPGELKPDEWSRFRLLFLEVWRPRGQPGLSAALRSTRSHLRKQALDLYVDRRIRERAAEEGVAVARLPAATQEALRADCKQNLALGLAALQGKDAADERLLQELERLLNAAQEPTEQVEE